MDLEHATRTGWANKDMKLDEDLKRSKEWEKKYIEQKKWKEIWDGQQQIHILKSNIENANGRKNSFLSPGHYRSESMGSTGFPNPKSRGEVFITNGDINENIISPRELYSRPSQK